MDIFGAGLTIACFQTLIKILSKMQEVVTLVTCGGKVSMHSDNICLISWSHPEAFILMRLKVCRTVGELTKLKLNVLRDLVKDV